jgi:uncharacterized protein (DUF1684 family)
MTTVAPTELPAAEDFRQQWERWHRDHEAVIGDRHGFLAVTSLNWLTGSPQRFPDAPGTWYTDPSGVHVELTQDEEIVVDGVVTHGRHDFGIIPERASLTVGWGDVVLEVGKRGGFDMLRPRHPSAPLVTGYRGTPAYPADRRWVVRGRFAAFDRPRPTTVGAAVEGLQHIYDAPGQVEFELDGTPLALTVFGGTDGGLLALFTDATSGVTTYAANRSLRLDPPAADGSVVLDFNRATNLPCAYTDLATCPLPPAENRLPPAIEAGETIPYERLDHADRVRSSELLAAEWAGRNG